MTILNQTEIIIANDILILVGLITFGIFAAFLCISIGSGWSHAVTTFIVIAVIISVVFTFMVGDGYIFGIPSGRYKYKCIVDDSASFTNIASKYNIVEQRGEIWVLEDKDDE